MEGWLCWPEDRQEVGLLARPLQAQSGAMASRRRVGCRAPCSGGARRVRPATEQRQPPSLGSGGTATPWLPCRPSSQLRHSPPQPHKTNLFFSLPLLVHSIPLFSRYEYGWFNCSQTLVRLFPQGCRHFSSRPLNSNCNTNNTIISMHIII